MDHGGADEVPVVSDPAGAVVTTSAGTTSAGPSCRSPCRVYVDRKEGFTVTVSRTGYVPKATEVKAQVGPEPKPFSSVLDENKGAVLIDSLTGANYIHVPNPVVVKLVPAS